MSLLQTLEHQQIARVMTDQGYLQSDPELRAIIIERAKDICKHGSEHGAIKMAQTVAYFDRMRQERELAMAGSQTTSIRLSAPANLADVHALLDAMRQPQQPTDANLAQVASAEQQNPPAVQAIEPPSSSTK